MDHQGAEGRHRLDHAARRGGSDDRVEAQHVVAERPVDAIAKLDYESAVSGREETHFD